MEIRVGISFVSAENAKRNMEVMVNGRNFEEVLVDTTAHWLDQIDELQVC